MIGISSTLLLASHNQETGDTLYTFILRYPRFILAEVNTHRALSRNTSSSRAIPSKKLRAKVRNEPVVPVRIGANQKGMQAGEELTGFKRSLAVGMWKAARYPALAAHYALEKFGVHKQITNRLIEPWMWVEQVVSATELDNFFELRNHEAAEPHFQILAKEMHSQVRYVKYRLAGAVEALADPYFDGVASTVGRIQTLKPDEWHLPFITGKEQGLELSKKLIVSAARCARVSYGLPGEVGFSSFERDLDLFKRLAGSNPKHLSPLEHQGVALDGDESIICRGDSNFRGFSQLRHLLNSRRGELSAEVMQPV